MQQGVDACFYGRLYDKLYSLGYHRKTEYSHAKVLSRMVLERWRPESVLDVGCSLGWTVEFFGMHGVRAVGVDVSRVAVQRGRRMGRDVRVGSAAALPFEDGAFDVVLSTDCLEHLRPEDARGSVHELARVARRGVAIKVNPREDRNRLWKFVAGTPLHLTCIPVATWLGWFAEEGFEVEEADEPREEYLLRRRDA